MLTKKPAATITRLLRNVVERLNGNAEAEDDVAGGRMFFAKRGLGGLSLTGGEARMVRDCVAKLVALQPGPIELRSLSPDACEDLVKTTILRALRPRRSESKDERKRFARRLNRELRAFQRTLLSPPKEWDVTLPVDGVLAAALPFDFGGVRFRRADATTTAGVAAVMADLGAVPRGLPHSLAVENAGRAALRDEIATELAEHQAIATVTVTASDGKAACAIGTERVRRSTDVLNFFAPFFERQARRRRMWVPPDGPRERPRKLAHCAATGAVHSPGKWPYDFPLEKMASGSDLAKQVGFGRADAILKSEGTTDLERRIASALAWAGRATTASRREEAFLLYFIALEALLTSERRRSGVTERLQLRIAHLIGTTPQQRKEISNQVGELYARRSSIVHAGDWKELGDQELRRLHDLVNHSLTAMLTHPPYLAMRTARELEQFLDDRRFQ